MVYILTLCLIGLSFCMLSEQAKLTDFRLSRYQRKCIPIQEKICSGFGYNTTVMPNILGHETQEEASTRIHEFSPLINSRCSTRLHFFLCSLYFPMCSPQVSVAITACKPVCEEVRELCEPIMRYFDLEWPTTIDCDKLPVQTEKRKLCMQPPISEQRENKNSSEFQGTYMIKDLPDSNLIGDIHEFNLSPLPGLKDLFQESTLDEDYGNYLTEDYENYLTEDDKFKDANGDTSSIDIEQPVKDNLDKAPFLVDTPKETTSELNQKYRCKNSLRFLFNKRTKQCTPRCDSGVDVLFSHRQKKSAFICLLVCGLLCFVSTAITMLTFLVDSSRFRYPEKPIIFLSLCYNIYSFAYLFRAITDDTSSISCASHEKGQMHYLVNGGFESSSCTAVFAILYYFGMAASAWWVVLSLTWFLSTGLKWSCEAIERWSFYFHLVAWLLPAVPTIIVLVLGKIDGDELTGMCYVGNMDPVAQMYFVIIPQTFYLLTGSVTLLFGFSYMFKIRRTLKNESGKAVGNLEKLMIKLGVFSLLYTIPATCLVAVNFYQYNNYQLWHIQAQNTPCVPALEDFDKMDHSSNEFEPNASYLGWIYQNFKQVDDENYQHSQRKDLNIRDLTGTMARSINNDELNSQYLQPARNIFQNNSDNKFNCRLDNSIPPFSIFIIKIIMSLFAGVTSGVWVWSKKTITTWKSFFCQKRWKTDLCKTTKKNRIPSSLLRENTCITLQPETPECDLRRQTCDFEPTVDKLQSLKKTKRTVDSKKYLKDWPTTSRLESSSRADMLYCSGSSRFLETITDSNTSSKSAWPNLTNIHNAHVKNFIKNSNDTLRI